MSFVWPTSHVGMLHPLAATGSKARAQGEMFLKLADLASQGIGYEASKAQFSVSHQQVETRKSLYEEFGLLYVPSGTDQMVLTPIGQQLLNLLGPVPTDTPTPDLKAQVDALLCWALANSQINRPQSLGSPTISAAERAACDVRPYALFWQALFDLGGRISFSEFEHVIARVQTIAEYSTALQRIADSRAQKAALVGIPQSQNFGIYWKSHLSVAGAVLQITASGDFQIVPGRSALLREILRSQRGCDLQSQDPLQARPWTSVADYFAFAGADCPPYIASGQPRLVNIGSGDIVLLKGYPLQTSDAGFEITGPIDWCAIPLSAPCFHADSSGRILRVDQKTISGGGVTLRLGLGRPIIDISLLMAAWNADEQ